MKETIEVKIRAFEPDDIGSMIEIWNEVVSDGVAFPQEELLGRETGTEFFNSQTHCGVAETSDGQIVGLYILHPNNVGRVGHIANTSYAVKSDYRGKHIGRKLVYDSLKRAKEKGFLILQFNAVVQTNRAARHLYEDMGFIPLGKIPKGFRLKSGEYEDIYPYYFDLTKLK